MCGQSIMEEINKYKDSSNLKLKTIILIYRFLRFCNGDIFYFMYSLLMVLTPLFVFNFSVGVIFIGMLLHYVIFMTYLKNKLDLLFKTKKEIEEIDKIIEILESHVKNKNPNV